MSTLTLQPPIAAATVNNLDVMHLVDVSDTGPLNPRGTSKQITIADLKIVMGSQNVAGLGRVWHSDALGNAIGSANLIFSVADNALKLTTNASIEFGTGDVDITHTGTEFSIINTAGNIVIRNTDNTGNIINRLGAITNTANFLFQNANSIDLLKISGDGISAFQSNTADTILEHRNITAANTANKVIYKTFLNITTTGLVEASKIQTNFDDISAANNVAHMVFSIRESNVLNPVLDLQGGGIVSINGVTQTVRLDTSNQSAASTNNVVRKSHFLNVTTTGLVEASRIETKLDNIGETTNTSRVSIFARFAGALQETLRVQGNDFPSHIGAILGSPNAAALTLRQANPTISNFTVRVTSQGTGLNSDGGSIFFTQSGVNKAVFGPQAVDLNISYISTTAASTANTIRHFDFLQIPTTGDVEASRIETSFSDIGTTTNTSTWTVLTRLNNVLTPTVFVAGENVGIGASPVTGSRLDVTINTPGSGSSSGYSFQLVNTNATANAVISQGFRAGGSIRAFIQAQNVGDTGGAQGALYLGTSQNGVLTRSVKLDELGNFTMGLVSTVATSRIHVAGINGPTSRIQLDRYSNNVAGGKFRTRKARGTINTPLAILSGDELGGYDGAAFDSAGFAVGAEMFFVASENWTASAHGTDVLYNTVLNGTTTNSSVMRISNNGAILLSDNAKTDTPFSRLYVIDSASFVGGATDNASTSAWSISIASGLVSFGTLVPTGVGIKTANVNGLAMSATTRAVAIGNAVSNSSHIANVQFQVISTIGASRPAPHMTTAQETTWLALTPLSGDQLYNTTLNRLRIHDGSALKSVAYLSDLQGSSDRVRVFTAVSNNTAAMGVADFYGVTDTSVARTITVSTADFVVGRTFIFTDESLAAGINNITIDTEGTQTIDGVADPSSVAITVNGGVIRLYVATTTTLKSW